MNNKQVSGVIKTSKSMFTFYTRPTFIVKDLKSRKKVEKSNSMSIHKHMEITKSVLAGKKQPQTTANEPNDEHDAQPNIINIKGSQIDKFSGRKSKTSKK